MNETRKIFVSFGANDRSFAERLLVHLSEAAGSRLTFVTADQVILPGENFIASVSRAIVECNSMIVIIPRSTDLSWLTSEIAMGLAQEQKNPSFTVIPLVHEAADLPHLLMGRVYIRISDVAFDPKIIDYIIEALLTDNTRQSRQRDNRTAEVGIRAEIEAFNQVKAVYALERRVSGAILVVSLGVGIVSAVIALAPFLISTGWGTTEFTSIVIPVATALAGFAFGWRARFSAKFEALAMKLGKHVR